MIKRSKRRDNFTVIPNGVVNDNSIDWKALGLLVYLLSKPDNWEVSIEHLSKQKKAGKDAIKAMLKELKLSGYVSTSRRSSGHVDWVVFDEPQVDNPHVEKPHVEKPHVEKPHVDNPTLINTERTLRTEKHNKQSEAVEIDTAGKDVGGGDFGEIIWSKSLSRKDVGTAGRMLEVVDSVDRQGLVDVLTALVEAGEVRKTAIACLGGLIRRYSAGTFDPSPGELVRARCDRSIRQQAVVPVAVNTDDVLAKHAEMLAKRDAARGRANE